MNWERKLALCFFASALLLALAMSCFGAALSRAESLAAFRAVLCPSDWRATVSQRYDKRDRFDWIVKRTWHTQCY